MVAGWRLPLFYVILAVYLLAGVLFATLTPNWQAPDEPAHFNYVHYLTVQSGFPELVSRCYNQAYLERLKSQRFPPELPLDSVCYEFHQPPLYYLLATPIFIISGGSLLALRLLSVILGAGVVTLAYFIAQTIFPGRPAIAYGTMALVAFVPMHVAMLSAVNNDVLAELILAALLLLLIRRLVSEGQPSTRSDIILGVLLGLGLITKTTVYIAIPLVAVGLWLAVIEERRRGSEEAGRQGTEEQRSKGAEEAGRGIRWPVLFKQAGIVFGLALAIALPWYMRNAVIYGNFDLLGLARHEAVVVGQLRTSDYLAQVGWPAYLYNFVTTTFQSFWGQFGWMAVPMSQRAYLALSLLSLAALGGLIGFGVWDLGFGKGISSPAAPCNTQHPTQNRQSQALLLMALTVGLMFLGYIWYNLEFVQFQGRYLFPALIPLSLFFSMGLYIAVSSRWAWLLAASLALTLVGVVLVAFWQGQAVDKWALLLVGLALVLALGRAWLKMRWPVSAWWVMMAVYAGLALLALVSPFWYVIPYLSR